MEIKIGIADIPREVVVTTQESPDAIVAGLSQAKADGGLFEVTDENGRRVIVPAERVAYLDLGSTGVRPVGFGAV